MIYQIYYHPQQRPFCFTSPPYFAITTRPELEYIQLSDDLRSLPTLSPLWVRQQLCEYSVMMFHWMSRCNQADWVGFTSWRQLMKGYPYVINKTDIELISRGSLLAWGHRRFNVPLDIQAEQNHPGLVAVLSQLLSDVHGESLPSEFSMSKEGLFCSYWAASKTLFDHYMNWSFPIMNEAIRRWQNDPPFNRHHGDEQLTGTNRSLAFLQERLFNVWVIKHNIGYINRTQE